jgi:hypothetical protein
MNTSKHPCDSCQKVINVCKSCPDIKKYKKQNKKKADKNK